MSRFFFPSFEKPVDRPRYLHVGQERRNFSGVGIVLLLAAVCGAGFALWEPSHQVTTPFTTTPASDAIVKAPETNAVAPQAEEDSVAPTVKLSTACAQRATARRDCASVKAFKDARLNAPEPADEPAKDSKPAVISKSVVAAKTSAPALASVATVTPAAVETEAPAVQAPKAPATPKTKRARPADEAPVERLVKVYDQVLPDGRRVPVYKRVGTGTLETGTIVDGEYRPARRANLDTPSGRLFGMQ